MTEFSEIIQSIDYENVLFLNKNTYILLCPVVNRKSIGHEAILGREIFIILL